MAPGLGIHKIRGPFRQFVGLLDQPFATGATAAYSLRKLKSSATKAVRVREDSGNTEADIGFSGGALDETALLNHCGSNNGFVTKWYDQSGNGNDASNSTATEQPQIVSGGTVVQENGEPALQFDGSDDFLQTTSSPELNNIYDNHGALVLVFAIDAFDNFVRLYAKGGTGGTSGGQHSLAINSSGFIEFEYHFSNNRLLEKFDSTNNKNQQRLIFNYNASNTSNRPSGVLNGSSLTTTTRDSPAGTRNDDTGKGLFLGAQFGGNFFAGKFQEFIYYPPNKTANEQKLSNNLENFYK